MRTASNLSCERDASRSRDSTWAFPAAPPCTRRRDVSYDRYHRHFTATYILIDQLEYWDALRQSNRIARAHMTGTFAFLESYKQSQWFPEGSRHSSLIMGYSKVSETGKRSATSKCDLGFLVF